MIRALNDVTNWLESQSPENLELEVPNLLIKLDRDSELTEKELILLKEMLKMFSNYNDNKINWQSLSLRPDTEITIHAIKKDYPLFLFDERISVKELMKFVLGLVKTKRNLKTKNVPRYKTVFKNALPKKDEDQARFSVRASDLQNIRIKFAKREKSAHSKQKTDSDNTEKGRIIRFSKKRQGNIAFIPTILNAVQNGKYSIKDKKFNISANDFLYPKYEENINYNIMLVLDTSKSISWVIPHIEKFISLITANASNFRDRLGLITFNNDLAKIYHYPTLNVKQVIGTINKIKAEGKTPLGEGLNLALQTFSKERYKLLGMKNLIILISDCYPEPLEGGHKNLLDEPAYKLVISTAKKIKEAKLGFIIINPSVEIKDKVSWAKKLIKKVISVSNAKYIEVNPTIKSTFFKGKSLIDEERFTKLANAIIQTKAEMIK